MGYVTDLTSREYALIFRRIKAKTRVLLTTGTTLSNTLSAERCGKNIARLLQYFNRNQIWLAERLGVAESTVSNWISGRNSPNDAMKDDIAALFGVDVEELYRKIKDGVAPAPVFMHKSREEIVEEVTKRVIESLDSLGLPLPKPKDKDKK